MRLRLFSITAIAGLLLLVAGFSLGDTSAKSVPNKQSTVLVTMLPASDAVVGFDSNRFFGQALPKLLASDQVLLTRILGHIDEVQTRTGVDLRRFDSAAAGLSIVRNGENEIVFEPVVIARGAAAPDTLSALDRLPKDTETRTEKIGGRTVYVVTGAAKAVTKVPTTKDSLYGPMIHRSITGLAKEFAITQIDENTIAFGTLTRVRALIENGSAVSPTLLTLLTGRESAVMSFAISTPQGLSEFVPIENDAFGATISSVRYMAGSVDINAAGAAMSVLARSEQASGARELKDTLIGLKKLGNAFLGNSKRADQRLYARLINSTKIEQTNNDVTIDLTIPQADVDSLIAGIKK